MLICSSRCCLHYAQSSLSIALFQQLILRDEIKMKVKMWTVGEDLQFLSGRLCLHQRDPRHQHTDTVG